MKSGKKVDPFNIESNLSLLIEHFFIVISIQDVGDYDSPYISVIIYERL